MSSPFVIIGASGHAAVVAQAEKPPGLNIIGHLADRPSTCSKGLLGAANYLVSLLPGHKDFSVFVAIGDIHLRKTLMNLLHGPYPSIGFASTIHPGAIIYEDGSVGNGASVAVGTKVGDFAILNTPASAGRDPVLAAGGGGSTRHLQ